MGADGSGADLLYSPMGGSRCRPSVASVQAGEHYLRMEGRPVFKWAVRLVAQTTREVLAAANLNISDLDLVALHQANLRIIDAAVEDLGLPREKVLINLDLYGNTSAASIPLVLDEANQAGRIHQGSRILISGFGAGLAWGTGIFQW